VPWRDKFPQADEKCLHVLDKMLRFLPCKRIDAEEALEHPYFSEVRAKAHEKRALTKLDLSFEKMDLAKEYLKARLWEATCYFRPEWTSIKLPFQYRTCDCLKAIQPVVEKNFVNLHMLHTLIIKAMGAHLACRHFDPNG